MPDFRVRARPPRGERGALTIVRDRDILESHFEDAAHFPGGHTTEIVAPTTETEVAEAICSVSAVLPIGAQSSLTGGATPRGERLLSTVRLNRICSIERDSVRVQAGVTLAQLDDALANRGRYYPPGPTFDGAFVGGTVSTNAAGAATFKYGTTRHWVQALTVVLASGDVLDIERGATVAHHDGYFDLELARTTVRVPIPTYRMPRVPKLSAGYFAAPDMDLVDLFVGSEGTLGIVTEITLRILEVVPAMCVAFVPFPDQVAAIAFARGLRQQALETWRTPDSQGIDISAIEYLDARCLELVREDGIGSTNGVRLPESAEAALLVTLELPPGTSASDAFDQLGRARNADPDTPLIKFCSMLDTVGVLDDVEVAMPGDRARRRQLLAVREGVPAAVNLRVGRAKRQVDPRIEKTAGDMIVPFERMPEALDCYQAGFRRRGLDAAVWGHVSDGNLHPNVIPRSVADVALGRQAILEFGREAIRLGGAPLAEHGVGRNPVKQQLLRELYGERGIDEMRRVKRAIDPEWKLAPGVLFPRHAQG